MATVFWSGSQLTKVWVITCTVGNAIAGVTYTLTANGAPLNYTAVGGDTTTSIATALLTAATASQNGGLTNHTELTFSQVGAAITTTGPANGANITAVPTATGSGTFTVTNTVTGTNPNDAGDVNNYSAFPANNDTLILPNNRPPIYYNLLALQFVTGLKIIREVAGPQVGLPKFRASGYAEWRDTRLAVPAASLSLYTSNQDVPEALKFDCGGTATAVQIVGQTSGSIRQEVCEVVGLAAGSSVRVTNASVHVCAKTTGTADVIDFVEAQNATLRASRYGSITAGLILGGNAEVGCNFTSITSNKNAIVRTVGSATGQPIVDGGSNSWVSSGNMVNPTVGSGGTITTADGIAAVAVTGVVTLLDGGKWLDAAARVTRPYTINGVRREVNSEDIDVGTHFALTVAAGP